jgi:hypothetical protein
VRRHADRGRCATDSPNGGRGAATGGGEEVSASSTARGADPTEVLDLGSVIRVRFSILGDEKGDSRDEFE